MARAKKAIQAVVSGDGVVQESVMMSTFIRKRFTFKESLSKLNMLSPMLLLLLQEHVLRMKNQSMNIGKTPPSLV